MTGDDGKLKFERGYRAKGAYLRKLRNKAKLSSKALAEKSDVHFTTINRIENGHNLAPQWHTLEQLGEALGVDALDLVYFLDDLPETPGLTNENVEKLEQRKRELDELDGVDHAARKERQSRSEDSL